MITSKNAKHFRESVDKKQELILIGGHILMKKHKKRVLGVFGISIVIAVCLFLRGDVNQDLISPLGQKDYPDATVVLYEGPETLRDAGEDDLVNTSEEKRDFSLMHCTDTQIMVNGRDCYVYDTNVNHSRRWSNNYLPSISRTPVAYFDFEGQVEITVCVPYKEFEKASVSPLSYGIEPEVDSEKKTVTFTISRPDSYTVFFDDSPLRAVHIFANPLETDIPDPEDEQVIYYGPGEWDVGAKLLMSGQTIYLAGGAVVHGTFKGLRGENITVRGRGILDGSGYPGWKGTDAHVPLQFDHCNGVTIRDILVLNSNAWVCQGYDSKDGVIDGLKIISCRPNSDGITLQSCENYIIRNCFVRSWDDSLVVKNYDNSSHDLTFSDIQIWTDLAQSMEVGYETNKGRRSESTIKDIKFENITVLNNFHKPVISVHNADDAAVSHIIFRNIVVEREEIGSGDGSQMPYLIDLHIVKSGNWSTTSERGTISDVTIENVSVLSGNKVNCRIKGFDEGHKITDVRIKNLRVLGEEITDPENPLLQIDASTSDGIRVE